MTIEEVKARVEAIQEKAGDDEVAHSMEDTLWSEVLSALADDNPIAAEALKTKDVVFARWCA